MTNNINRIHYNAFKWEADEQLGGAKTTPTSEPNYLDGLSKNEMIELDSDKDGYITEDEFKAKFSKADKNSSATQQAWNSYLEAFQQKNNSKTVSFVNGRGDYLNQNILNSLEVALRAQDKNTYTYVVSLKNEWGLNLSDEEIYNAFVVISDNLGKNSIGIKELGALVYLADLADTNQKYLSGTVDGKITADGLYTAIKNLNDGDGQTLNNLKQLSKSIIPDKTTTVNTTSTIISTTIQTSDTSITLVDSKYDYAKQDIYNVIEDKFTMNGVIDNTMINNSLKYLGVDTSKYNAEQITTLLKEKLGVKNITAKELAAFLYVADLSDSGDTNITGNADGKITGQGIIKAINGLSVNDAKTVSNLKTLYKNILPSINTASTISSTTTQTYNTEIKLVNSKYDYTKQDILDVITDKFTINGSIDKAMINNSLNYLGVDTKTYNADLIISLLQNKLGVSNITERELGAFLYVADLLDSGDTNITGNADGKITGKGITQALNSLYSNDTKTIANLKTLYKNIIPKSKSTSSGTSSITNSSSNTTNSQNVSYSQLTSKAIHYKAIQDLYNDATYKMLDANNDGFVTKEEYNAKLSAITAETNAAWDASLKAFQEKNKSVELVNGRGAYGKQDILDKVQEYMTDGKVDSTKLTVLLNSLGTALNANNVISDLSTALGVANIGARELASLFYLADLADTGEKYITGQVDGKITASGLYIAINNIRNKDYQTLQNLKTLYKDAISTSTSSTSSTSSTYTASAVDLAKMEKQQAVIEAEIAITKAENEQNEAVGLIKQDIKFWKSQMNTQIVMLERRIELLQEQNPVNETEIANVENEIKRVKEEYRAKIGEGEKEQFNTNFGYEAIVICRKYELSEIKKDNKDIDSTTLFNKLQDITTYMKQKLETVYELQAKTYAEVETLINSIYNDVNGEAVAQLIKEYPDIKKDIKNFIKDEIKAIRKKIEAFIDEEKEDKLSELQNLKVKEYAKLGTSTTETTQSTETTVITKATSTVTSLTPEEYQAIQKTIIDAQEKYLEEKHVLDNNLEAINKGYSDTNGTKHNGFNSIENLINLM